MPDEELGAILRRSPEEWHGWRQRHPEVRSPDLTGVELSGSRLSDADLRGVQLGGANLTRADIDRADLRRANLRKADLTHSFLHEAKLSGADLRGAKLVGANFCRADLRKARLQGADLHRANLDRADLRGADLTGANLERAILVDSKVEGARFVRCRVHGAAVWGLRLEQTEQATSGEAEVTVDDLKVAQFVHALLTNEEIRSVIDAITSKVVLILGNFSEERKPSLDALRAELRRRDRSPIVFDFSIPLSRSMTDTVELLARMARYVVADLSDPRAVPGELATLAPRLTKVPIQAIIVKPQKPYAGYQDLVEAYSWVLKPVVYASKQDLIRILDDKVLRPAEAMRKKLVRSS